MIQSFGFSDFLQILDSIPWTLALSVLAFVGGALGGIVVAIARISRQPFVKLIATAYVRVFQGMPLMIVLLLAFFAPPAFLQVEISPWIAALVGFSLYASAGVGEILRSAIVALPRGQYDAARVLGLSRVRIWSDVLFPQAFRVALPSLVGFAVQLIKATSLASAIGFVDLAHTAQMINSRTFKPFTTFAIVALIYFAICWPLSLLGTKLESRSQ